MRLLNRVVLITGANNPFGIGAEVARALAQEGARIAITYQSSVRRTIATESAPGDTFYDIQRAKNADEVKASITAAGGIVVASEADLGDPEASGRLFAWAEAALGPVDILVNCAAHFEGTDDSVLSITAAGIDKTFAINVRAAILMIQEFVRRHRRRGATYGRIINFSSDSAPCFPGQIAYGASKAALEALTRSIAREVGGMGITVNTVAPGPVQTGYITRDAVRELEAEIPISRVGNPDDVAAAVLYFALPSASWTTGQVLRVAGGHDL